MKLILFDVDGTLTPPRKNIEQPMLECLKRLKQFPIYILYYNMYIIICILVKNF